MAFPSQRHQILDQRFFQLTGLVLVMGTLMAGTIMLLLANDMGKKEMLIVATSATETQPTPLLAAEEFGGQTAEVNISFKLERNGVGRPLR